MLNSLGTSVTENDLSSTGNALIFNDLFGTQVQFTAVVLTNPLNSGLSTATATDNPSRIHVFVRDTSAVSMGVEGMGLQLVDGSWETTGILDLSVGDVIDVVGDIGGFGATLQLAPVSITLIGDMTSFGFPDSLLDPVTVTTADINPAAGAEGEVLPDWNTVADYRHQYVRIEAARIVDRDASDTRPDWDFSSDNGMSFLQTYDISLRYRNDRGGTNYETLGFNVLEEDFVPPPIGATVNVQGFLTFSSFDPFNRSAAMDDVIFNINPMEDSDLEVTAAPPTILSVDRPAANPSVTDGFASSAVVTPGAERTLTRVEFMYSIDGGMATSVSTTADADTFSTTIPGPGTDDVWMEYWVEAEDDLGAVVTSPVEVVRFLEAVDAIEDIQMTMDGGPGDSPFKDIVTTMDITATVQTDAASSTILAVQDDPDLAAWSGIFIDPEGIDVARGDVINITEATPERRDQFGFQNETWLTDVTYTVTSTGGMPYDYKEVNTDLLQDESIAEAHQGMMLKFNDVVITNNDTGFGQWAFATLNMDGSEQESVQADDVSPLVAGGDELFAGGEQLEFIQGAWIFAFGTYRILPEDPATDFGALTNTSNEDLSVPGTFGLAQNFPNPFNPVTSINYAVPVAGQVTLEVFDILGRSVGMLVDGVMAAGEHTVRFEAGDLPSGMYLYRLSAGEKVSTKKMLLLK